MSELSVHDMREEMSCGFLGGIVTLIIMLKLFLALMGMGMSST